MFACLAVSEAITGAIYGSLALQNLGNCIPVFVVILDAVLLHPFGDCNIGTSDDVADCVEIFPECDLEAVADTCVKAFFAPFGQIVVQTDVPMLEARQYYFDLAREWLQLRTVVLVLGLWFEE